MFVRSSKHRDLQARYEQAIEQRDEAVKAADEHVCQIVNLAREIDALRETTHVVAVPQPPQPGLQEENERLKRDLARLQQRLDDAVCLTSSGIADSSVWQPGYEPPKPKAGAS